MKKTTAVLFVCAALIIGLAVGGLSVFYFGTRFVVNGTSSGETAEAALIIRALQQLRSGNSPAAIELLESRLDGALISINSLWLSTPGTPSDDAAKHAIQMAKSYREKFPRKTTNAEVDEAVEQALNSPKAQ